MAVPLDTRNIAHRRILRFQAVDEVLADVAALASAESAGRLRQLGNWTFGQTLGHLAAWVGFSYDGVPMKVPLIVRWMLRLGKKKFLYSPMGPGRKLPRVTGGTLGTEVISSAEGLARFQAAFERIKREPPAMPHMLFGRLTHHEWINQHLRHAELHLSFFAVEKD
jgi:hypothetical protein